MRGVVGTVGPSASASIGAASTRVDDGGAGVVVRRRCRRAVPLPASCAAATPVCCSAPGAPRPGVGSNSTQPMPSNHTSGHAWAWRPYTWYRPSALQLALGEADRHPGRQPDGSGHRRERAGELLAVARRMRRKLSIASLLWPLCTFRSYVNSLRNQFCSASALSYGVVAPAVTAQRGFATSSGRLRQVEVRRGSVRRSTVAARSSSADGS